MPAQPRTALWLTAYVVACLLGRIIIVQPHSVGVVWPASGLALVWLASALTRKQLVIHTVLLSVSTAVMIALTDGSTLQSLLALLSVIQTLVALWLIRRWVPHLWGGGGRESMSKLGDFGRILAAVAFGALAMAVLRTALGREGAPPAGVRQPDRERLQVRREGHSSARPDSRPSAQTTAGPG